MIVRLLGVDEPLAQQQLDVTVIAGAREHVAVRARDRGGCRPHAPTRRTRCCTRHTRAGGARPLLERQLHAELHHFLVRAPERQVQEPQRIEQRLRRVPEGLDDHLWVTSRGARAFGVAAHAVGHHQQRRVLGDGHAHPVLVFLAPAEQAEIRVFNLQEATHVSVRLLARFISPDAHGVALMARATARAPNRMKSIIYPGGAHDREHDRLRAPRDHRPLGHAGVRTAQRQPPFSGGGPAPARGAARGSKAEMRARLARQVRAARSIARSPTGARTAWPAALEVDPEALERVVAAAQVVEPLAARARRP